MQAFYLDYDTDMHGGTSAFFLCHVRDESNYLLRAKPTGSSFQNFFYSRKVY